MSAGPFRSHLLQSWVRTTSGNQSRPPVAVVPWLQNKHQSSKKKNVDDDDDDGKHPLRNKQDMSCITPSFHLPSISSIDTTPSASPNQTRRSFHNLMSMLSQHPSSPTVTEEEYNSYMNSNSGHFNDDDNNSGIPSMPSLSLSQLLRRRRLELRRLLKRIVQEATEEESSSLLYPLLSCESIPFQLKSLVAPSKVIDGMLEVLMKMHRYEVGAMAEDDASFARRIEEWRRIPAFLVAVIPGSVDADGESGNNTSHIHNRNNAKASTIMRIQHQADDNGDDDAEDRYNHTPLEYRPPATQEELEKYAATIAAMQNIMTQLRNQHNVSSKWTTDALIHVPAFRKLIGIDNSTKNGAQDRIVGILCIGTDSDSL
mmetsp:Transcript_26969/g.75852  ORF Transcript_26969/g.75852 Transcript_26969/m.75852 type:complete len:371 (+) Transcript_26969:106-1218(+)